MVIYFSCWVGVNQGSRNRVFSLGVMVPLVVAENHGCVFGGVDWMWMRALQY